jgi:hypothetical protein
MLNNYLEGILSILRSLSLDQAHHASDEKVYWTTVSNHKSQHGNYGLIIARQA